MNKIDTLRRGKHYSFNFTHKKNVYGIVCDVDLDRKSFVVYNMSTKDYESIPDYRFINADLLK